MPMSGTFTMPYDGQTMQPGGPGRMVSDERGSNLDRSPGQPMDHAQLTVAERVTMDRGQGPMAGTVTFTTPDGTTTSPCTARVSTDAQGRVTAPGRS